MKVFKVIGNVTLCRSHPGYVGGRLLATEPLENALLGGAAPAAPDLLVVWDDLGAGQDATIAVSDGAEAAQPFRPEWKAVDAYCTAILDAIHIDPQAVQVCRKQENN
ncbi:MAG: carbon dioxide concentrating mechanism protein CcmL [Planctomycetales bacterium]|nr:carbon dioxide concentrating mechanism protein CcmL [Planctomycetales bacterium]